MSTVPLSLTAQGRAIHNVCGDQALILTGPVRLTERREYPHGAVLHGGELCAAALASRGAGEIEPCVTVVAGRSCGQTLIHASPTSCPR